MIKRLNIISFHKIFTAFLRQGSLFIFCVILSFLLHGCLSSKKVTGMVKAFDKSVVKEQFTSLELPAGIRFILLNPLPDSSSVRKSYVMVLPLIVINYFQTNYKLTLGQSSLENPTIELFKTELINNLNPLQWELLYQNGYAININVHEFTSTGVFASGFWAAFAGAYETGAGTGGEISHNMRIKSEVYVSLDLNCNDNTLDHRDFMFLVKANEFGKLKIVNTDLRSGRAVTMPTSLPNVVPGHSFELLIPSTKEVYNICIKMVSREIVNVVENYVLQYCSR
jgi:hypothetical protein